MGDTCRISLPKWVLDAGERDPSIFYTDRAGVRNRECISLGCDELPVLGGRTPVAAYAEFMSAFADEFNDMLGARGGAGAGAAGRARAGAGRAGCLQRGAAVSGGVPLLPCLRPAGC